MPIEFVVSSYACFEVFFYGFSGIIPLTEENRSNFPIRPNLLRVRLQMALKFVS